MTSVGSGQVAGARLAVVAAALLACGGAIVATMALSHRPREATRLARRLETLILERALVAAEYLSRSEERPRRQWREHSAQIEELLGRYERVGDAGARRTLAEVRGLERRAAEIFGVVEGAGPGRPGGDAETRAALRSLAVDTLPLLAFELYGRAKLLVQLEAENEQSRERVALLAVAVVAAAALAAVTFDAYRNSTRVARRIAALEEGARRIAAGDLEHRIQLPGEDPLAALGRTFDQMAERLAAGVAELEASNRDLERFASSVSHDLRAPLRHVSGFVDLLAERIRGRLDPQGLEYVALVQSAVRRMGQLIDDLLAFSRLGRAGLKPSPVDLGPVVDEVVAEVSRAERHAEEVVWEIAALPRVVADATLLRAVWTNLVGNALKFSRGRAVARIEIGACPAEGETRFFVKDNGVGFDPRWAASLFGVFQRLHRQDEFEGNGIGLANVQRIVQRHGGRVWAEGRPGEGATFWFSLPRPPAGG